MAKGGKKLLKTSNRRTSCTVEQVAQSVKIKKLSQRLSPETITALVEDYQAGLSSPQLQAKYCLSKGSVLGLLAQQGVERRRQSLSNERVAELARLYESGLTVREIVVRTGTPKTTIQGALRAADVTMRAAHRRKRADD